MILSTYISVAMGIESVLAASAHGTVPPSTLIANVPQNQEPIRLRDEYYGFIRRHLEEMELPENTSRILAEHKEDIIDIAVCALYGSMRGGLTYTRKSDKVIKDWIKTSITPYRDFLVLSTPLLRLPVGGITFFDRIEDLYVIYADIEGDVEKLSVLPCLRQLDCSGNRLTRLPDLSQFPMLASANFSFNCIVVEGDEDFKSNNRIECIFLWGIPSASRYRGRSLPGIDMIYASP